VQPEYSPFSTTVPTSFIEKDCGASPSPFDVAPGEAPATANEYAKQVSSTAMAFGGDPLPIQLKVTVI
jgi:hypothetical protein